MTQTRPIHLETRAEEVASGITHAVGLILAAVAATLLICVASLSGDPRRIISVSIYGTTLLLTYAASTCYHVVRLPRAKHLFRVLDHISIYLLIAGTYTPVLLVSLRGGWGWSLFGVVWGLALLGTTAKACFFDRYELLSIITYVAMGWLALVGIKPLIAALPAGGLAWTFAGGAAYTVGVVFFLWDHLPFNHAIWHGFVIAGSVCHFVLVLLYVLPMTP